MKQNKWEEANVNECSRILSEVKQAVVGKDRVLAWVLTTLLAGGHILLEDVPGVGKTTIALAFARAMGMEYGRVQFTPDVLPSDITGYSMYEKQTGQMRYQPGAVLCNLFLADELNRATSRTQSALLEAMEEGQVTVDGVSHPIPQPFMVIATQNPTGAAGTQLLPDSQLDRFAIRLSVGYPEAKDELRMLQTRSAGNPLDRVRQAVTLDEVLQLQRSVADVFVHEDVAAYLVALMQATRSHPMLLRGASPRTTLSVCAMARAVAFLHGRDYVVPADVQSVLPYTVAHRLLLTPEAEAQGLTTREVLQQLQRQVPAPKLA